MTDSPLLFLDANVLVSPVTRTLLIAGARAAGLRWTWSQHVETEADRHARGGSTAVSRVRQVILETELSPTASNCEGLRTVSPKDAQVIADAIEAKAEFLITSDVDDFAFEDLAEHGISAVNPDYFMSLKFSEAAYREAVGMLAAVQRNPSRGEAEVHQMLGRRHPRLTERFADAYDARPIVPDADQPSVIFRGSSCVMCGAHLYSKQRLSSGLCVTHAV